MVVQCPICDARFPASEIENHAEECIEKRFGNTSEPITFDQMSDAINVPTRHSSCTKTSSSPSSGKKSRKEQAEAWSFLGGYRSPAQPRDRKNKWPGRDQAPHDLASSSHTENAHSSFPQQSVQKSGDNSGVPLAEKMRPATLDNYIGQASILSSNSFLKNLIMQNNFINMILWGPPGCGKTSLANIIHERCRGSDKWRYVSLSACTSGVQDVKNVVREAQGALQMRKKRTVLFMDEVHRFNKAQQDIFLPHVESGVLTLVGATTENPSFTLNSALISRCRVITLDALGPSCIRVIVKRALKRLKITIERKTKVKVENGEKVNEGGVGSEEDEEEEEQEDEETEAEETDDAPRSYKENNEGFSISSNVRISTEAIHWLSEMSGGDARCALSTLQILVDSHNSKLITISDAKEALQRSHVLYDRKGDEHYNFASALQKSIRGGDDNAALYWTTRMIKGGEDPRFIARRLVRTAAEDIGELLDLLEEHWEDITNEELQQLEQERVREEKEAKEETIAHSRPKTLTLKGVQKILDLVSQTVEVMGEEDPDTKHAGTIIAGLGTPEALTHSVAAMQAVQMLGMPESDVILAQCAVYLARAQHNPEVYLAMRRVNEHIDNHAGPLPTVPLHLRNASTKLMKNLGYGSGYSAAPQNVRNIQYMPDALKNLNFFNP
ncbi:ATPase WRNIP1-like [Homarus americanus]|uniref:ATPase WRNIP1-like n=1 Tax=Homarus americanus TaxID=6706 RepID=A0A8J5TVV8_HOMAM|nr:ATPase WRNIP1-like [Homarus americanus]